MDIIFSGQKSQKIKGAHSSMEDMTVLLRH